MKAKNAEEYIAQQRLALAANPDCGTTHYNLAVALLGQKKNDEAEKELIAAIECSPTLAEAYVQLGGLCLQRGDLDGCLEYNQRAVRSRAGFSEGYGNIGFVHLQRGEVEEAIRDALNRSGSDPMPSACVTFFDSHAGININNFNDDQRVFQEDLRPCADVTVN